MVSLNAHEVDLVGLHQALQTDVVVVVEGGGVQREDLLGLVVEGLEPRRLLGVDNSILVEHDQHSSVEVGESGLSHGRVGALGVVLVVQSGQEHGVLLVVLHVAHISEVAGGSQPVLDRLQVNQLSGGGVQDAAQNSVGAVGNGIDTHVGASDGEHVPDGTGHIALLDDVSSEEATLRETDHVELTLEIGVLGDLLARLISDSLEVIEVLSESRESNLNAVSRGVSSLAELLGETLHARVDASIAESVEDSGRDTLRLGVVPGAADIIGLQGVEGRVVVLVNERLGDLFLEEFHEGARFVVAVVLLLGLHFLDELLTFVLHHVLDSLLVIHVHLLLVLEELADGALVLFVRVLVDFMVMVLFVLNRSGLLGICALLATANSVKNTPSHPSLEVPGSLSSLVVVRNLVAVAERALEELSFGGSNGGQSEDRLAEHFLF
mmetsp:Transcript_26192/g.39987  ORF Transcript_26192/g.39987 Transcript_26192/m.39987 type:complete len:437 (-) Transcript_26192:14-1324(-)